MQQLMFEVRIENAFTVTSHTFEFEYQSWLAWKHTFENNLLRTWLTRWSSAAFLIGKEESGGPRAGCRSAARRASCAPGSLPRRRSSPSAWLLSGTHPFIYTLGGSCSAVSMPTLASLRFADFVQIWRLQPSRGKKKLHTFAPLQTQIVSKKSV